MALLHVPFFSGAALAQMYFSYFAIADFGKPDGRGILASITSGHVLTPTCGPRQQRPRINPLLIML